MKQPARRSSRATPLFVTPTSKTVKPGVTLSKSAKTANVKGPASGKEESETKNYIETKVL